MRAVNKLQGENDREHECNNKYKTGMLEPHYMGQMWDFLRSVFSTKYTEKKTDLLISPRLAPFGLISDIHKKGLYKGFEPNIQGSLFFQIK